MAFDRARGEQPPQPTAVTRFREFADWYVRLNAIRGGNPPPFARIRLNDELARLGWIPEEIERSTGSGRRASVVRCRHLSVWELSSKDRQWIETAGEYMARFQALSPQAYMSPPAKSKPAK